MFSQEFVTYFTKDDESLVKTLKSPQYVGRHPLARSSMYMQLVNLPAEMSTRSHLFFYEFNSRLKQALVCIAVELLANPNDLKDLGSLMVRYVILEQLNVKTGIFKVLYAVAALSHTLPDTFRKSVQSECLNCLQQMWNQDMSDSDMFFSEYDPTAWESCNLLDILLSDIEVAARHYLQNGLGKLLALLQFMFFADNGRCQYVQSFVADYIEFASKKSEYPLQILFHVKFLVRAVAPFCKKYLKDRTARFKFINFLLDSIDRVLELCSYGNNVKPSLGLLEIVDYVSFLLSNSTEIFTFSDFQRLRSRRCPFRITFPISN